MAKGRLGILRPLKNRDFALLWTGMTVSLLGDGLYVVALAWQVYQLSNTPTALSVVGIAWFVPQIVFALLGGVLSDRFDRRHVLIGSDMVRGLAMAAVGLLSVTGQLELWHVIALVAVYGAGEAFFGPAFGAIVPDVVPKEQLLEANSLDQFVRPIAGRLVGPAIGGFIVAGFGAGPAFLIDAASFAVSAVALSLMASRWRPEPSESPGAMLREIREGFDYVMERSWLWGTLAAAAVGLLCFFGPWQVLVPYIIKNSLHGDARDLGWVLGAGGVSAVLSALAIGQRELPGRPIQFIYVCWSAGSLAIGGFALAASVWQAMVVSFVMTGLLTAGMIVWATLLHRIVPATLLGRVSSFDWMVSFGLIPVSYAVTGPLAAGIGVHATMYLAAVLGAAVVLAFLAIPGIRQIDQEGVDRVAEKVDRATAAA